jgi:uncharacterized protein (DUF433 family)
MHASKRPARVNRQTDRDPYRGRDPRQTPAYTLDDSARYLRIPEQTIRNWSYGYTYRTPSGRQGRTPPLIAVETGARHDFSFFNLVELHVLSALRQEHNVRMPKIRRAIEYLKEQLNSPRPLLDEDMETNGLDIFVNKFGSLINASAHGQLAMKALLHAHLKRIDRDSHGIALRLFPFTRTRAEYADPEKAAVQPRVIAIDPSVAFGRPVIVGSRVPTSEIFERFNTGESPDELAADFDRRLEEILEAIRCESATAA